MGYLQSNKKIQKKIKISAKKIPDFYNNLDKVYSKIWDLLKSGLINRNSPFHLPVFICGENKNFDGRTVVLRGINKKNKSLWFHTDIR